jgi:hypothetical protein
MAQHGRHVRKGRAALDRRRKNTIPAGIRRFWREVAAAREAMLPKKAKA